MVAYFHVYKNPNSTSPELGIVLHICKVLFFVSPSGSTEKGKLGFIVPHRTTLMNYLCKSHKDMHANFKRGKLLPSQFGFLLDQSQCHLMSGGDELPLLVLKRRKYPLLKVRFLFSYLQSVNPVRRFLFEYK